MDSGTRKWQTIIKDLKERIELRLIKTNIFKSGVVQLIYEPKNKVEHH
ncbi:hypothetical protein [Pseudopedobacter sp.]